MGQLYLVSTHQTIAGQDRARHLRAVALDQQDLISGMKIGSQLAQSSRPDRSNEQAGGGGAHAVSANVAGIRGGRVLVDGNDVELVKATRSVGLGCGIVTTRPGGAVQDGNAHGPRRYVHALVISCSAV